MKYIIIFILVITLTGCKSKELKNSKKIDNVEEKIAKPEDKNYKDENPIKVGLYQNNKKVHEVTYKKANHVEIGTYNAFYTDLETLPNDSVKNNWYNIWWFESL